MTSNGGTRPSGRVITNLQAVSAVLVGAVGLLLAFQAAPDFAAWASAPRISVLAATMAILLLSLLLTVVTTLLARERRNLQQQTASEKRALEGQLSAEKAKNENLKSVMSDLEVNAYYDVLTGVPNSRYLARLLSDQNARGPRCLILLDLRNFGSINKRFNHWKGDAYLSRFASIVLQGSRRNEHVMKYRPLANLDSPELIRKSEGGDEFYILLRGTVIDGLGYLSRLLRRRAEFEQMAAHLLGAQHAFAFRAGLVSLAYDDSYDLAVGRVSQALCKAMDNPAVSVYWPDEETRYLDDRERAVVNQAKIDFGDPHAD